MPKIQGKQIADNTITQVNLNLTTPSSGDTTSGATVQYINEYVSNYVSNNSGVIGPAEDGEYTDGIFTDFTTGTTIGTAVDRFNEMFKLLAPTPPSGNWTGAFSTTIPTLSTTPISTTPKMINNSGNVASYPVVTTLTPSFTISSTVGSGLNAKTINGTFTFTLKDYNGTTIESVTINSGSTTKSSGILQYTINDTYSGQGAGKEGFWTGCTGFSGVTFQSSSITPGTTTRNLYFEHPTGQSKIGTTFYVDNVSPNTPTITNYTIGTLPTMTRWVSGVPSLINGSTLTGIGFDILNASTYFYAPNIWNIVGTRVSTISGSPDTPLTLTGETAHITNRTATITGGYAESISFTITPYNRSSSAGTTSGVSYSNLRIDTVSNESSRLVSGTGSYPSTGYGAAWGSNSGTSLLVNTNELQMLNGSYRFPANVDYTPYGGTDYRTIQSGTRWVTFNLGTFNNNQTFDLTFVGSSNITDRVNVPSLLVEAKIEGATNWVNGDKSFVVGTNPGSTADPDMGAVVYGSSSNTVRRITFGNPTYSGSIIVRIGLTSSSTITFTGLSANIVS